VIKRLGMAILAALQRRHRPLFEVRTLDAYSQRWRQHDRCWADERQGRQCPRPAETPLGLCRGHDAVLSV
jgi:hypothetical protein